ncbi:MAG: FGGY family carbohydrate kinase [Sphaerochaeta sp.]|nr:FGGY family carbohydrate kinase [Sphaerochaeta sp.]
MKKDCIQCVGFDCGNSSIRTVIGRYDGSSIEMELVQKEPNGAVTVNGVHYWDILNIFNIMQNGLKKAVETYGHIDSVGITTWGIDFGLLGPSGHLLNNPFCYRNEFGVKGLESVDEETRQRLFELTGIQNHPMNSLYQLVGIRTLIPEYYSFAKDLLLVPDLLTYMFTGKKATESTIASTSQLLDMRTQQYSQEVLDLMGLEKSMFHPVVPHGEVRGMMLPSIAEKLNIPSIPFISVPSHDTASAVVSVPATSETFVFISSGTWSLIGTELSEPIIDSKVFEHSFANEGGALGTITLLKNSAGMHIIKNIKDEMSVSFGKDFSWDELLDMAEQAGVSVSLYDPNSTKLFNPERIIEAIQDLSGEVDISRVLASSYISLACSYREAIDSLEEITGSAFEQVHIIGGGSRNGYLNQLAANISGKVIIAGPDEATSLGVIAMQILHHDPSQSLSGIRKMISKSFHPIPYHPDPQFPSDALYAQYLSKKDIENSLS